jgi:hypothetical protein
MKSIIGAGAGAAVWPAPRVEGFSIVPDYAAACSGPGANLVSNGTFTADLSGWTLTQPGGTSVAQTGGEARLRAQPCGVAAVIHQDIALPGATQNCNYKLTATVRTAGHYAGYCYSHCVQSVSNTCSPSNTGLRYLSLCETNGALIREWRFNGPIATATSFSLVLNVGTRSAIRIRATQYGGFHCTCSCSGAGGAGCGSDANSGDFFLDNVQFAASVDPITNAFTATCPTGGTGC